MSHSQSVASKTIAAVERARQDVNDLKAHVQQMLRSESASEQSMGQNLTKHTQHVEALVEKAETTVKRIKNVGRVPPRPTASVPPSVRAKRSLSVLLSGLDSDDIRPDSEKPFDKTTDPTKAKTAEKPADKSARNVKQKAGPIPEPTPLPFLSAAGKPTATPLREEDFAATLIRVAKETDLTVGRMGTRGVGFECRNVFRAFVWFKEADAPPSSKPSAPDAATPTYIVPEHIGCFGVDESNASRWSCSRYAVFKVITERANAAVRYFMAREKTGEDAFLALAKWLARHKTLFTAQCEDRRLAFDASRGIFLPACIYPFEGHGPPRFTRGSIPLRSNSSYATQPTVRVPSNNHGSNNSGAQGAQAGGPNASSGPGGAVTSGGSANLGAGATHNAPVAQSTGARITRQAVTAAPGGIGQVDMRTMSSRSRG